MVLPRPPSGDHREGAVNVEITRIESENLTTSDGQGVAETVTSVAPDGTEQEERAEV
jgi:hypothetical protein